MLTSFSSVPQLPKILACPTQSIWVFTTRGVFWSKGLGGQGVRRKGLTGQGVWKKGFTSQEVRRKGVHWSVGLEEEVHLSGGRGLLARESGGLGVHWSGGQQKGDQWSWGLEEGVLWSGVQEVKGFTGQKVLGQGVRSKGFWGNIFGVWRTVFKVLGSGV